MIRIILIALLLSSCADFERNMHKNKPLDCTPIYSTCAQNQNLLICDTANKTECYGWITK